MGLLMTMLFCVITLVSHKEELSIKDSNCDVEHTTLLQILLSILQFKVTEINQNLSFMTLCKSEIICIIL